MPTRRAVELSVTALISLIQKENLGESHAVLAGGERYVSPRFQEEAEREVREELRRAGLDDDFRDTLALVQRARVEYYGWITSGGDSSAVLVAASGRAAVVLTRVGDRVSLMRADPDRLVESLTLRLPDVPAGRGESISIRAADYATTAGYLRKPVGARSPEARRLDTLLQATRLGGAQLYAARRDTAGVRRRAKDWITVLDVAQHGRWAVYSTQGRGERAVNAVPATPKLLASKLAELQGSITPRS